MIDLVSRIGQTYGEVPLKIKIHIYRKSMIHPIQGRRIDVLVEVPNFHQDDWSEAIPDPGKTTILIESSL